MAQTNTVVFLPMAGLGISTFRNELMQAKQFSNIIVPELGVAARYAIRSGYGVEAALLYQEKGSKLYGNSVAISLKYITIPLGINLHMGGAKWLTLGVGGYIAKLLDKTITDTPLITIDANEIRNIDYGFDMKLTLRTLPVWQRYVGIYVKSQYGVADVYTPKKMFQLNKVSTVWHRLTYFSAGVIYPMP